ncbi:hypothetical protein Tco_0629682 [Tanacetum coccineum]|uniref:Uncharacterized protein n=1 Tax=Tanacetum coccineum TaxID=301880 RepID=A0ABQ4WTV5_9ASTR
MNSFVDNASVNMHECKKYLKLETELLNKTDCIEKKTYDKLFRSYTTLKKHYISLEVDTQLNQEIFQWENSVSNQSALNFDQYFELNELKDQSQEKDTAIRKLKEKIKSLSGNVNEDKQLYHLIKPTRIRTKEQCDALINQVNQKSVEISDLNVSLQEKGLVIAALKDELRKLKGKDLANNIVTKHTIAPEILKFDVEPIAPKLLNNRTAHSNYLRHTQEQASILREVVEQGKSQNPLNNSLDSTKTSGSDKPRHPVLQMLWGIVTQTNVDHAELYGFILGISSLSLKKIGKGKPTFQLVDEDVEAQPRSFPQEEGDDPDIENSAKKYEFGSTSRKGRRGKGDDADMERELFKIRLGIPDFLQ